MCRSKKKVICKYDANWFKEQMEKRWDKIIELDEIGSESVFLEHGEVDEDMIPFQQLQLLPNPLLAHSFIYVDDKGDEWICIVVSGEFNPINDHEIWIKNNEEIK